MGRFRQFLNQAPACGCDEPEFAAVVNERFGQNSGLLQQVAIEVESCDHVACVVRNLGDGFAPVSERSESRDDLIYASLFFMSQLRQLFKRAHSFDTFQSGLRIQACVLFQYTQRAKVGQFV